MFRVHTSSLYSDFTAESLELSIGLPASCFKVKALTATTGNAYAGDNYKTCE